MKYNAANFRKLQNARLKRYGIKPKGKRGRPRVSLDYQREKAAERKRRQREADKQFCLTHFGCTDPDTVIRKMRRGEIAIPARQES